jgi:hypothetical protein
MIPLRGSFPVHLVSRHDVAAVVTNWLLPNWHSIFRNEIKQLQRTYSALFDGRSSPQWAVASQPDIARQMRAKRLSPWIQCQRFLLPRLGRAARSKARREQIIGDAEPPPGSRDEPGSTAPSVPLPPAHSPCRGVHAKGDRCSSSPAFRTHVYVALDVVFSVAGIG